MTGILATLGRFVATASAGALPAEDRELQERHFGDSIVAGAVGLQSADHRAMRPLWGGSTDGEVALLAAAMRMTEIDDIHLPSCTTPSSVISPVALMLGGASRRAHEAVRDALWVGMDLLVRFGMATDGPSLLYRNVWPTYLAGPMASAATAARLLGLDDQRSAVALSLALTLTAGGSGRFAETKSPRWLLHGKGVELGVFAARAAGAGFRADSDLLDGSWLEQTHGIVLDRMVLTERLGTGSVYPSLSMKPFSSAKQAIGAIEAFGTLLGQGIEVDAIETVTVHVPPIYARMIEREPKPDARNYASAAYQIALAAYHPETLYRCFGAGMPWDDSVKRFMKKVTVIPDENLAPHYPQRWPARVVIVAGGVRQEASVTAAAGDPERRLDKAAIAEKARRVFAPVGVEPAGWLELADGCLDDFDKMSRLMALVRDGVSSPIATPA